MVNEDCEHDIFDEMLLSNYSVLIKTWNTEIRGHTVIIEDIQDMGDEGNDIIYSITILLLESP